MKRPTRRRNGSGSRGGRPRGDRESSPRTNRWTLQSSRGVQIPWGCIWHEFGTHSLAMRFHVHDLAIECIRSLREPVQRIRLHDPNLADQLRRAASSMVLNIAEGRWRTGKDKTNRFRIAAGSASEFHACLELAEAWGLVSAALVAKPLEQIDRLLAMTWRLLNPRNPPRPPPTSPSSSSRRPSDCHSASRPEPEPNSDTDLD